jgi:hypothetical protein
MHRIAVAVWIMVGGAFRLAAQSYGLGDQVLTIAAPSFHGEHNLPVIHADDGYLYNLDPTDENGSVYFAPVVLPDGAVITQMCLYARNQEANLNVLSVGMQRFILAPGGAAPGGGAVPGSGVGVTFNFGYGVVCTDPMSYVFHDDADIDNDGNPEHISHRLEALVFAGSTVGLGGVRITWHRQVTPPPVTQTFGDVPPDQQFFQFIEALAASGITGGCGGGNYCPDAPLTRGQMAAFLAKALGLYWSN